jgi:hypothetical protein
MGRKMPSHHESLQNSSRGDPAVLQFPSGKWRGFYRLGEHSHTSLSFDMTFHNIFPHLGTIQGSDKNNVGKYYIKNGRFNCINNRLAFTKKYSKGICNPFENLGHKEVFQGTLQGHPTAGVRGWWFVATYPYRL